MNRQTKIALILSMMTLVVVMVWLFGNSKQTASDREEKYTSSDWTNETDNVITDKDPYGLFLFHTVLKAHIDSNKTIENVQDFTYLDSILADGKKRTLLYIGDEFALTNPEKHKIFEKVEEGNVLFISFDILSQNILDELFSSCTISYDYNDSANIFVEDTRFTFHFIHQTDTLARRWNMFSEFLPKDSVYFALSTLFDMPNFVAIQHGKGTIFLHTNPELFRNYQLKRGDGFAYASYAIDHLEKDRNVCILDLGILVESSVADENSDQGGGGNQEDESYLSFLLSSPALMAALFLTLLGFILFVIFRSKRLQPFVPFVSKKKNMSKAFADTITSIYMAKQNPFALLVVQRKNFYSAVLKHFFVDLSKELENRDKQLATLSGKSGVPSEEIRELLSLLETSDKNITNEYVTEVGVKQRAFYERTGILQKALLEKIARRNFTVHRELVFSSLLILSGIILFLTGLYFLVYAVGIGIVLWPFGTIIFGVGIARLSRPIVKIDEENIEHFPVIGKKCVYPKDTLKQINTNQGMVEFYFTDGKRLKFKTREISRFDKHQLNLFISNFNQHTK